MEIIEQIEGINSSKNRKIASGDCVSPNLHKRPSIPIPTYSKEKKKRKQAQIPFRGDRQLATTKAMLG